MQPSLGQSFFPPFRLDAANERLWRDEEVVPLRPKLFALLRYLVDHSSRLVTREELLEGVWPGTVLSEGVLRGCIKALREALDDDAQAPRFIETVARRGYRFIAPLTNVAPASLGERTLSERRPALVGRGAELARLSRVFDRMLQGERQVVFLTGEPGIGKTSLVTEFARSRSPDANLWIGQGHCVEHYGSGEAYLPLLMALGQAARGTGGPLLVSLLRRHAPTWLAQMPAFLGIDERQALQDRLAVTTHERMLRELVEAVDVISAERPLFLVLEDLHWADPSTVDWIAAVGKRKQGARLLLIGTYRPAEVGFPDHPLKAAKQELHAHGSCEEIWLPFLTPEHVSEIVSSRLSNRPSSPDLGLTIHRRTDGNPLFVVNVLDYLLAAGMIAEVDGRWKLRSDREAIERVVPESLRQLIDKQFDRLEARDRRMLEVASVAGSEFSAATVAEALEEPLETVEERCEELARRGQFLASLDPHPAPGGGMSGRYRFLHGLYPTVLYDRLAGARRARLHRRIGGIEESEYEGRAEEIAAGLAMHFERGGDALRAVTYRAEAAHMALRSHAYREAFDHLSRALDRLASLPGTPERARQEMDLQMRLGGVLTMTKGYAASEVEACYARARELGTQLGESGAQAVPLLFGLWMVTLVRAQLERAEALAVELVAAADEARDPANLAYAYMALGASQFWQGRFGESCTALERAVELSRAVEQIETLLLGSHAGVLSLAYLGIARWFLGFPDQARTAAEDAVLLAKGLGHPHNLAVALYFAAWVDQVRGEERKVEERAEEILRLATEHDFPIWSASATVLGGWARCKAGSPPGIVSAIERAADAHRATGTRIAQGHLRSLLAEAYGRVGRPARGVEELDEMLAIAERTGERSCEAVMLCLRGELLLQRAQGKGRDASGIVHRERQAEAEGFFRRAIEVARRQGAQSIELRATLGLARLLDSRNAGGGASIVAEVLARFTEGFDTPDLVRAKGFATARSVRNRK